MSDFDKEAERERLREKYERDREEREATQRMSDLLLKGATMTNAHCDECGSPIFRQNDRTFCPTCGAEAVEADAEDERGAAADADAAEIEVETEDEAGAETAGSADRTREDAESAANAGADATREQSEAPARRTAGDPQGRDEAAPVDRRPAESSRARRSSEPSGERAPRTRDRGADGATGDATVADAERALTAALTRHARAADTDDPRTARDHLEAAREAAEALAALRR